MLKIIQSRDRLIFNTENPIPRKDGLYLSIPNFNGCTVWEWISNIISHFTGHVITLYVINFYAGIKVKLR